jgi:biopolymer transport protein ExbB
MNFLKRLFLCAVVSIACLHGQSPVDLQQIQQSKLEDAIQRLNAQRNEIQQQQLPLARKLSALEQTARQLRADLVEARKVRDSYSVDLETLKRTVDEQAKEYDYITRTLFSEYISNYESSLSAGELETYGAAVRELNLFLENQEATETQRLQRSLDLLKDSVAQIKSTIGGKIYPGSALSTDSLLVDGTFIQLGPLLYFSDASGKDAGLVKESKSLQPQVLSIGKKPSSMISELALNKTGRLPMDLSMGNALAIQQTKDSFLEHLDKGGQWVYPIIAFALVSACIALLKFIQILSIRQPAISVVQKLVEQLREGHSDKALALARAQPEPARDVLVQAVTHSEDSVELVEESMYESILSAQPKLERHLNIIAITASVAPLLGLLGTVTGIIKTFNLMKVFGAGDPKQLISGISEALITTELGLILAIPALVIHAILSRKTAGIMAHTERISVAFINSFSRIKKG